MKIRNFNHALDLIVRTMLPYAVDTQGHIRVAVEPYQLYCPLCAVAQCAHPDNLARSGVYPCTSAPWADYELSDALEARILDAADNLGTEADRARLLAACGLA